MSGLIYILIGAGVAGGVVAFLMTRKQKEQQARRDARDAAVHSAEATNDITQVGPGGVIKLPPFGDQLGPVETHVVTRHRMVDDDDMPFYALECEHGARTLTVEWSREGGDLYVVAGYEDGQPKLRDLGLEEDDLVRMDDREKGKFEWDGTTWHYEYSGEVTYYADDGTQGEVYYAWEFESDDEKRYVSIERWKRDRGYGVYVTHAIKPQRIEVFEAGEIKGQA
ncbi:MAG: hypothetical protein ACE366_28455 [Bradymonadia bacterium]